MSTSLVLLVALVLFVIGALGWIAWLRISSSPDGERYRRRRAQGPFAAIVDPDDVPAARHP